MLTLQQPYIIQSMRPLLLTWARLLVGIHKEWRYLMNKLLSLLSILPILKFSLIVVKEPFETNSAIYKNFLFVELFLDQFMPSPRLAQYTPFPLNTPVIYVSYLNSYLNKCIIFFNFKMFKIKPKNEKRSIKMEKG